MDSLSENRLATLLWKGWLADVPARLSPLRGRLRKAKRCSVYHALTLRIGVSSITVEGFQQGDVNSWAIIAPIPSYRDEQLDAIVTSQRRRREWVANSTREGCR
jgi:hypothetical protein